jgi:hypothetical protein
LLLLVVVVVVVLGTELMGLVFAKQVLYHLSPNSSSQEKETLTRPFYHKLI